MIDWYAKVVECRLCGEQHVSVYPSNITEEENQECPACGHMTCEPLMEQTDD